jgi:hypothetical protein
MRKRLWLTGVAAMALAALTACGGDDAATPGPSPTPTPAPSPTPSPAPSAPPSVEREISPGLTSAAVDRNLSPHVAINPSPALAARQRLFVMLPGTAAVPRTYRLILREGAARGYHVLGLTYPNDDAVESLCNASSDPDCAGKVRREVITGANASPLVDVNEANAIVARLIALLAYLDRTFPQEEWGRYLVAGQPDWGRITVAGHSQGAGHAGFLAKLHALDRVVMFSGPADSGSADGEAVSWARLANVTPPERQYGFTHRADPLASQAQVTANWAVQGLGLSGAPVLVDGNAPPFGNSRQLLTAASPNPNPTGPSAAPAHGAPVVDAVTPLTATGSPLFAPVWAYLAFP